MPLHNGDGKIQPIYGKLYIAGAARHKKSSRKIMQTILYIDIGKFEIYQITLVYLAIMAMARYKQYMASYILGARNYIKNKKEISCKLYLPLICAYLIFIKLQSCTWPLWRWRDTCNTWQAAYWEHKTKYKQNRNIFRLCSTSIWAYLKFTHLQSCTSSL